MLLKPLSRALTNPNVFACRYNVEDHGIQVGILLLSEDFQPGMHFLYDLDTEQRYHVHIDSVTSPQYTIKLPYAALQNAETC